MNVSLIVVTQFMFNSAEWLTYFSIYLDKEKQLTVIVYLVGVSLLLFIWSNQWVVNILEEQEFKALSTHYRVMSTNFGIKSLTWFIIDIS